MIEEVVQNERVKRLYVAYKANNKVHIRVHEVLDGGTVTDTTQAYGLADDGETVSHSGKQWEDHARMRFSELNNSRFAHEFQELRGEL